MGETSTQRLWAKMLGHWFAIVVIFFVSVAVISPIAFYGAFGSSGKLARGYFDQNAYELTHHTNTY
jgi:hypothetical protein